MRITHLALTVRDPERSRLFYVDVLGLAATTRQEEWGYRLRTVDGMEFALITGEPLPADVIDRIHFGSSVPEAAAVHALRERLGHDGVAEVEWWDVEGYTSLKVADPDGYVVEFSYEDG